MAIEVKLSTTGTLSPITFLSLGGISFTHPTVDFHLLEPNGPFLLEELTDNAELQSAIDSEHITLLNSRDEPIDSVSSEALIDTTDLYDAVVAADGTGQYTSPGHAFNDGAKTVFIRDGLYVEDSDIIIPDGGALIGETPSGVIIDLAATYQIKADASNGVKETAGTIAITTNTQNVTGDSTTFTNLSPGDFILVGMVFYEIATITDNTNLTLSETYYGKTVSKASYQAHSMYTGVTLSNFHVINGMTNNIMLRGCRHSKIETVGTSKANNAGLLIEDCGQSYGAGILADNNNMYGIDLETCFGISLNSIDANNNQWAGIYTDSCGSVIIDSSYIKTNKDDGISVTGTANEVKIADSIICFNGVKGIDTGGSSEGISAINCTLSDNGNAGIDFDSDKNIVSSCHIFNNGSYGIQAGDNGVISENHINNNGGNGLNLAGDDDCTASGNIIHDNAGDGIYANGTRNVVTGNRIYGNKGNGMTLDASSGENLVTSNLVSGHTTNISDTGTANAIVGNLAL